MRIPFLEAIQFQDKIVNFELSKGLGITAVCSSESLAHKQLARPEGYAHSVSVYIYIYIYP